MIVRLVRLESSPEGTFGTLTLEGYKFSTAELPWESNQPTQSCIPVGDYVCVWHNSPKFGNCYQLLDVPGRSHILIHSGNFAGDEPTWQSDVEGCILLGERRGVLKNKKGKMQKCVTGSKVAMAKFHKITEREDLLLKVTEQFNG